MLNLLITILAVIILIFVVFHTGYTIYNGYYGPCGNSSNIYGTPFIFGTNKLPSGTEVKCNPTYPRMQIVYPNNPSNPNNPNAKLVTITGDYLAEKGIQ